MTRFRIVSTAAAGLLAGGMATAAWAASPGAETTKVADAVKADVRQIVT